MLTIFPSLKSRLLFAFIIVILSFSLVVSLAIFKLSRSTLSTQADILETLSQDQMLSIEKNISSLIKLSRLVARRLEESTSLGADSNLFLLMEPIASLYQRAFEHQLLSHPYIVQIELLDIDSKLIYRSQSTRSAESLSLGATATIDSAGWAVLPRYSKNKLFLAIVVPIVDSDGKYLAQQVMYLDASRFFQSIFEFSSKNSDIYIVDKENRIQYSTFTYDFASRLDQHDKLYGTNEQTGSGLSSYRGREMLFGFSVVTSNLFIKEWKIITSLAVEPLTERRNALILFVVAGFIIALLISILTSTLLFNSINAPVTFLLSRMQMLQNKTEPATPPPEFNINEMATLVSQYESMAKELTSYRADLEQRIQDRTRELEQEVALRAQSQKLLQTQRDELKRSNRDLEQFAYVASHDLQEPLRMVASYLELVDRQYTDKLDEDGKQFMEFAIDGAKRLKILISDLLKFSRVNTRGKALEPTDTGKLMEQITQDLEIKITETNTEVLYDQLPVVMGDPGQLYSLFLNLLGNAIKFSDKDLPRVSISAKDLGDGFHEFAVSDNGIGISEDYFEKIFVIFQRLHGQNEYSGTGIGLALCKQIVERHGGRIWVESTVGEGTTFFFTLPAAGEA